MSSYLDSLTSNANNVIQTFPVHVSHIFMCSGTRSLVGAVSIYCEMLHSSLQIFPFLEVELVV